MKYQIYAKILGNFFSDKSIRIGACTIKKDYIQLSLDDDRPNIPVTDKNLEHHILGQTVRNYIFYPQSPISVRTFESEHIITTEINSRSDYDAMKIAYDRFTDVTNSLSLSMKSTVRTLGKKRYRSIDDNYDFEIFALFRKQGKDLIRLKMPKPLINGHNYFPKTPPKNFITRARKYLNFKDPIFVKGLMYLNRANSMNDSGNFNGTDKALNLIKCIELVSRWVDKDNRFGLSKTDYDNLRAKEVFKLAGKLIKVTSKNITKAQKAWDLRNKGDLAHQHPGFNPYDKSSTHPVSGLVYYPDLESAASEYLIKYFQYRLKHPILRFNYF